MSLPQILLKRSKGVHFARWVFLLVSVSGVIAVVPPYFLEAEVGKNSPPAINHPEFYYGFFGVTLARQLMFLVIATDPIRYRMTMLPAMVEKLSFAGAIFALFVFGRVPPSLLGLAGMDGTLFILFVIAYLETRANGLARGFTKHVFQSGELVHAPQ